MSILRSRDQRTFLTLKSAIEYAVGFQQDCDILKLDKSNPALLAGFMDKFYVVQPVPDGGLLAGYIKVAEMRLEMKTTYTHLEEG